MSAFITLILLVHIFQYILEYMETLYIVTVISISSGSVMIMTPLNGLAIPD